MKATFNWGSTERDCRSECGTKVHDKRGERFWKVICEWLLIVNCVKKTETKTWNVHISVHIQSTYFFYIEKYNICWGLLTARYLKFSHMLWMSCLYWLNSIRVADAEFPQPLSLLPYEWSALDSVHTESSATH